MSAETTDVIREELERLKHAYDDLRREIRELRGADAGLSRRRGVLASAGTTAESLLKFIYRREGREKGSKPADKLMLDDLVGALKDVLPEHIQVPLRTVQAYRNLGAHDKGDIRSVDEQALLTVNTALNQVVVWFFEAYLGGEFAALAKTRDHDEPTGATAEKPALVEWRELYWWLMRGGQLKLLDQKALEKRQRESGLTDAEVGAVRSNHKRDVETFLQTVSEAVEDGVLEDYEVEGLEEMRVSACLSVREAQELAAEGLRKVRSVPAGAPGWMQKIATAAPAPVPVRLEANNLLKAKETAKPVAKQVQGRNPKRSEAESLRKKLKDSNQPSIRGGKWWRDKHGHVRYGKKPEGAGDDEREWKEIDDGEVTNLHLELDAVYAYHAGARKALCQLLAKQGLDPDMLLSVFRDANTLGVPVKDYWLDCAENAGLSEADATEAFDQMTNKYQEAMKDDFFRRAASDAIKRRQVEEGMAMQAVEDTRGFTKGTYTELLSKDVKSQSIRLMGLMRSMGLLHRPTRAREAADIFDTAEEAQQLVGSIVNSKSRLTALYGRLGELNTSQLIAVYIAQRIRDMREGGFGFKGERTVDQYFKDEDGDIRDDELPAYDPDDAAAIAAATDTERANVLLNTEIADALGLDDISEKERTTTLKRLNELAYSVINEVESNNNYTGGQDIGTVLSPPV